jgi:hypothetical protein
MVKHHILIGLGFKKQNFRNRGLRHMLDRAGKAVSRVVGGALPQNQMTIQPVSRPFPKVGSAARRPLKFNY